MNFIQITSIKKPQFLILKGFLLKSLLKNFLSFAIQVCVILNLERVKRDSGACHFES